MDPLEITKGTLKTLAGQIPVVGPVLAGVFGARDKEVQEAQLREFLEDLRSEFSRLLPADFDRQYLESQDFAHLLLLAAEHAQRARRQEKRRLYALAIVNAGTHEWAGQSDLAEELLNALADLSWTEVRILHAAWECSSPILVEAEDGPTPRLMPNTSFTGGDVAVAAPDLGLTSREAGAYLLRLQRLGLTEVAAVTAGAGPGTFQLTALMERLMNLICARG